jgi:Cellulose binding domain
MSDARTSSGIRASSSTGRRERARGVRPLPALVVLLLAAAGLIFSSALNAAAAAKPAANPAAATPTGASTPTSTGATCPPVVPTAAFQSATTNSLTFSYQWVCNTTLTIALTNDPEGRSVVTSAPTRIGVQNGTLTFHDLPPNRTYYWSYTVADPSFTRTGLGPVSTLDGESTPTASCIAVLPEAQFDSATTSSISFWYYWACGSTRITLSLTNDAAGKDVVATRTSPLGQTSGLITFTGLPPGTSYYWSRFVNTFGGVGRGPVSTLRADSSPTVTASVSPTSPRPTGTFTCPPVLGWSSLADATTTSLTFSYSVPLPNGCVDPGPGHGAYTLSLFSDAGGTALVKKLVTPAGSTGGTLTFTGLDPGTTYWYTYSSADPRYDGPVQGPVSTVGTVQPSPCTAVMSVLSSWDDGFVTSVQITNRDPSRSLAWKVSWTWGGGQTLVDAYSATVGGTPQSPQLTGASWNRTLAPGSSTSVVVRGQGRVGSTLPALGCSPT